MAAGAHFGYVRNSILIAFLVISDRYATLIIIFVRNSLSIEFLAFSNRYATLFVLEIFHKMVAVCHFGCPKFTFDRISGNFRSIRHLIGCSKITFDSNSGHFRSIQNLFFSAAILDVRKSLSMAFLAISDPYGTFFLIFDKMATGGHFGCPKITFDRISGHFRSISNFLIFVDKMATGGHFGWDDNVNYRTRPKYLDE